MDVSLLVKQRLQELGLEQKDLASASEVTESYISQLLAGKKVPPAPARTDIYEKISQFLGLPEGELAKLAEVQRNNELKKRVSQPPPPLFKECRDLIVRKCNASRRGEVQRIFEKETFGELERLITQTILEVAQGIARDELRSEEWLRLMAQLSMRSYEQLRVATLEFLDTDALHISAEGCVSFLDPIIDSWDINLRTFATEIVLNRRLAPARVKHFEFREVLTRRDRQHEPGFEKFLNDPLLSGDATEEEIEFLKQLTFEKKRPTAMYYYRELQSLRDHLHFEKS